MYIEDLIKRTNFLVSLKFPEKILDCLGCISFDKKPIILSFQSGSAKGNTPFLGIDKQPCRCQQ